MTLRIVSKKLFYSMFGVALLFMVACKKDKDAPGPGPGNGTKQLVKIQENANNYMTFDYNTDGTFNKITNVSDDDEVIELGTMTFVYNSNKKISEINSNNGTKIKYVYANNAVSVAEIYDENEEKISFIDFTYQGGKLSSSTMSSIMEDEEGGTIEIPFLKLSYQYYANGDVKETQIFNTNLMTGELELSSVLKYEQYDNKINPLAQMGEIGLLFFSDVSTRNVLLQKTFDSEGTLEETVQNEYTYDAQGYPLTNKETTTPAGGTAEVKNITYSYK